MAAKRQTSVPDLETYKANDGVQKIRIKELEDEVSSLKKRLDDLRKAKNTTILKREREVLEVGTPFAKRDSKDDLKVANLEKKLQATDQKRDKEMDDLRKKFASEMEALKRSNQKTNCSHQPVLRKLRYRIEDLETENKACRSKNEEMSEQVEGLMTGLLLKEAQWCALEEELTTELKISIGEKYKDWMNTTEAKIKELQETNETLRGYLKNKK
ncbi:uncharacterized protein LOC126829723 isoform X2 [Patella vulgata]|uniref:uncharacterized protein LOC126829723 isoform X2 n=1 Tax=Patella vulgata TaxID=6465 RepID=UPI00217F7D67|nr:uncharacterized protein LOC126829723 isoform X2 [Patella vulgata]